MQLAATVLLVPLIVSAAAAVWRMVQIWKEEAQ